MICSQNMACGSYSIKFLIIRRILLLELSLKMGSDCSTFPSDLYVSMRLYLYLKILNIYVSFFIQGYNWVPTQE